MNSMMRDFVINNRCEQLYDEASVIQKYYNIADVTPQVCRSMGDTPMKWSGLAGNLSEYTSGAVVYPVLVKTNGSIKDTKVNKTVVVKYGLLTEDGAIDWVLYSVGDYTARKRKRADSTESRSTPTISKD